MNHGSDKGAARVAAALLAGGMIVIGATLASAASAPAVIATPSLSTGLNRDGGTRLYWRFEGSIRRSTVLIIERGPDASHFQALQTVTRPRSSGFLNDPALPGVTLYRARLTVSGVAGAWSTSVSVGSVGAPTTVAPTTVPRTTVPPTTVPPTTVPPTTVAPTTVAPTTTAATVPPTVPATVPPTTVPRTTVPPTVPVTTVPAPTTVPVTTPPTTATPGGQPALGAGQKECPADYVGLVTVLTNQQRSANGLGPVADESRLQQAARVHSISMATRQTLDHLNWVEEIKATGFPIGSAAQNAALGQPTPSSVVSGWMASTGHRANILNAGYHQTGVGCVQDADNRFWWTQNFAS